MKKIISLLLVAILLFSTSTVYASEKQSISISGLKTTIYTTNSSSIIDNISVKPNATIKLQYYNRDAKKWQTKYTTKANNGKATLNYPSIYKHHSVSYWRAYCPATPSTREYISPKITVVKKAKAQLGLSCKSAVIIEKNTGKAIYSKNMNEERAMASTTKLMTALLVFENCKMDEIVTISTDAPKTSYGILELKAGDKYTVEQLLNALLIPSANDSAVALACHISGSQKEFVKLMNKKANQLGLKRTKYKSPYGLDAEEHYSSAHDISIIHSQLLKYEEYRNIEAKSSCNITNVSRTKEKQFSTTNKILNKYNNIISGKTGTTTKAKYCFSGAYKYKGATYVFTILGATSDTNRWKDCKKLIKFIQSNA